MEETKLSITHRAFVESEHFSYEAYGSSEDAARKALMTGLEEHAGQMGTAPEWPEEMMPQARLCMVGAGGSMFSDFDLETFGLELVAPHEGDVAYRAMTETRTKDGTWGYVDGLGRDEAEARGAVEDGLRVMHADNPDGEMRIARGIEETEVYPVREGSSYRGGLTCNMGEPLA